MKHHNTFIRMVKSKTVTISISVPNAEQQEFSFVVGRNARDIAPL